MLCCVGFAFAPLLDAPCPRPLLLIRQRRCSCSCAISPTLTWTILTSLLSGEAPSPLYVFVCARHPISVSPPPSFCSAWPRPLCANLKMNIFICICVYASLIYLHLYPVVSFLAPVQSHVMLCSLTPGISTGTSATPGPRASSPAPTERTRSLPRRCVRSFQSQRQRENTPILSESMTPPVVRKISLERFLCQKQNL